MQFDRIDKSFLKHASSLELKDGLQAERSDCEPRLTTTVERPDIESAHGVACSQKERISDSSQTEMSEEVVPDKVLGMLLAAVPEQWEALADQVVGACAKGHRVIGIAGHRAQEGRTTIARGTADVLRSRGRKVRYVGSSQELWRELVGSSHLWPQCQDQNGCGELHDKEDVVLVDSGVWFTPGPFRKQDIASRAFGCDAVLLVRHADVLPCPSRQQLLMSLGIYPIGEVVTFSGDKECEPVSRELLGASCHA